MSYTFEKHTVETFEVTDVLVDFMPYHSYSRVRKDKPKCELCGTAFQKDDNTNLAMVKNKTNMLICDTCATKAIEGGAKKAERKQDELKGKDNKHE